MDSNRSIGYYRAVVKAEITLAGGVKVIVDGTPGEIEEVTRRLAGPVADAPRHQKAPLKGRTAPPSVTKKIPTLKDYVLELRENGLFKKTQGLSDIKEALAADGHVVPITTLSGCMLGLVKSRDLRRIKEDGTWKYVNR